MKNLKERSEEVRPYDDDKSSGYLPGLAKKVQKEESGIQENPSIMEGIERLTLLLDYSRDVKLRTELLNNLIYRREEPRSSEKGGMLAEEKILTLGELICTLVEEIQFEINKIDQVNHDTAKGIE